MCGRSSLKLIFNPDLTLSIKQFAPQTLHGSISEKDIPITGGKLCQDAGLCIYFNKLKMKLFFPGVSPGFS